MSVNVFLCLTIYLAGTVYLCSNYKLSDKEKVSEWFLLIGDFAFFAALGLLFQLERIREVFTFQVLAPW